MQARNISHYVLGYPFETHQVEREGLDAASGFYTKKIRGVERKTVVIGRKNHSLKCSFIDNASVLYVHFHAAKVGERENR